MNTSTLNKLRDNINNVSFQEGNLRSLAMSLTSLVEISEAWFIAKAVAKRYGNYFTIQDLTDYVNHGNIEVVSNEETKISEREIEINSFNPIVLPKNQIIRGLLSEGKSVSEISKTLNLTYQRVKNIEKAIRRKSLEAFKEATVEEKY